MIGKVSRTTGRRKVPARLTSRILAREHSGDVIAKFHPLLCTLVVCAVAAAAFQAHAADRAALLHTAPLEAPERQPLEVEGTLVGVEKLSRIVVRYRGPDEPYAEVQMQREYGDLFRAYIPEGALVAPGVEYYVEGQVASGARVPLFADAQRPARVFVLLPLTRERTQSRDAGVSSAQAPARRQQTR